MSGSLTPHAHGPNERIDQACCQRKITESQSAARASDAREEDFWSAARAADAALKRRLCSEPPNAAAVLETPTPTA